jgi:Flp pilus assembly protein CpaB
MKQNNLGKLIGIALVVAIIATGVFYGLFVTKLSSSTGSGKMVIVASRPIPAGTVLAEKDVQSMTWAGEQTPSGAFDNAQQVTGHTVLEPLTQGEPVLASRLASAGAGVLALLRPGQKVDVQVLLTRKIANAEPELRTILEGVPVLAVNPTPEAAQGTNLPSVTLLTNPADADTLALADSGARIRLALRNPLDQATRSRTALTLDSLLRATGQAAAPETKFQTKLQ